MIIQCFLFFLFFCQLHSSVNITEVEKMSIFLFYRKPTTLTDSDGEAELQGLVSNILDEAVSQNGYNGRYMAFMFSF